MTGLDSLIADLKTAYAARNPQSAQAFERALAVMPGGNSRTQLYFEPFPFYVDHAKVPTFTISTAIAISMWSTTPRA